MKRIFTLSLLALSLFAWTLVGTDAGHAANVVAKVDISKQRMDVYVGGKRKYSWPVSTGRRGYRTPTGSYSVKRMHTMWYSRKYHNSPMPHSLFFRGGYAVHGTGAIKNLGRPASHGCIRLHPTNAKALFSLTRRYGPGNTRIKIVR